MMRNGHIRVVLEVSIWFLFWAGLVGSVGVPAEGWAESSTTNPFAGDPDAIAEGALVFEAVCTGYCHVMQTGSQRDAKCPNLFDCEWKHGSSDEEVFRIMTNGVPQTEMQGFKGQLPDEMLWQVIAYIRSASQCQDEKPAVMSAH